MCVSVVEQYTLHTVHTLSCILYNLCVYYAGTRNTHEHRSSSSISNFKTCNNTIFKMFTHNKEPLDFSNHRVFSMHSHWSCKVKWLLWKQVVFIALKWAITVKMIRSMEYIKLSLTSHVRESRFQINTRNIEDYSLFTISWHITCTHIVGLFSRLSK